MFDEFQQTATAIFENARSNGKLIRNPDSARLKALALEEPGVRQTRYGSIYSESEPMSRAAKRTKNNVDSNFGREEHELLEQANSLWPARSSCRSTLWWATAPKASRPGLSCPGNSPT